jgi:PAS domain S-box-containing protein
VNAPSSPSNALTEGLFQVEHQLLLRAIVNNPSEGVIITDAVGVPLYMSPSSRKFYGPEIKNNTQQEMDQYYHVYFPDTRTRIPLEELPHSRVLRGEECPTADIFVRASHLPEGQHIRTSVRPVRDEGGTLLGTVIFLRDITQERQAEAEQRRVEQRFRAMVEAVQEGIWMIDETGHTTYVNLYMAQMLGYTVDEMQGRSVLDFHPKANHDQVRGGLESERAGQAGVHDTALLHKEGREVWTQMSSKPMFDEVGRYIGSLAAVTNITHRRETEQQVRRLNEDLEQRITERTAQLEFSNRELESFAYSVAHDLRAPLRSISSFTLALADDCADQLDATGLDYLQRIRAASKRMSELIDGILSLSRVTRGELQRADVNLTTMARSIIEQLQRLQPRRAVSVRIQEELMGQGDAQLLRSVMENLLGNAWKFTRERSLVEIEFGVVPGGAAERVYFIRDNGAGFDMEYQAKLFGVFQRLHTQQEFEGTGIGLATVQRIIQRHGGRVWAEGRVGRGATFFFTLHAPQSGSFPRIKMEK